ncbi:MAG: flippase [Atribacterota bacterium]|nr:flippase [Atribacterota bacterium]
MILKIAHKIVNNFKIKARISDGFKKYTANTAYLFLEKTIRAIVNLTVWVAVVRYVGPEQFGIFSYALSFVVLLSILSSLGLEAIAVKELVHKEKEQNRILGSVFFLNLLGSISAVVLTLLITHFMPIDLYIRTIIIIISLRLIIQSFNNIDFYFQSRVNSKYTVFSQLTSLFFTTFLCLLFIYFRKPLIYFVSIVVIEAMVTSICFILFYHKLGQKIILWKVDFKIVKALLNNSWPIIFAGFAIVVYMRIDQLMIKEILGMTYVGYYAAAVRVSESIYFIPLIITTSLFPSIIKTRLIDNALYKDRLYILFNFLFWLAIIISFIGLIFARPIILFLYGEEFLPSVQVLIIHIWASIFVFWEAARTKWAINGNLQIYLMLYAIIGAVVNIILNLILIPRYSIQGAAIALVSSYFIFVVLCNFLSKKTREMFFIQMRSINILNLFRR